MPRRLSFVLALLFPLAASAATDDWVTVNKDYSSQRYVDLDQINPSNVTNLKEVCEIDLNEASTFSSGILKIGRTLYVSTPRESYAIDAVTCKLVWQKLVENRDDVLLGKLDVPRIATTVNNRGLGYLNGMLFRGTTDGRVIALDAKTGAQRWEYDARKDPVPGGGKDCNIFAKWGAPNLARSVVAAPIAWHDARSNSDQIFFGIATADLGVCGQLIGLDAKSGAYRWAFHTIPKEMESKKLRGGAFWTSFSLDVETGEVFAAASNPNPDYDNGSRPGDNVHTDSVLSLDAAKGTLNWAYQAMAGQPAGGKRSQSDVHDWDLATAPDLYTAKSGARMLAVAGKDGLIYGLKRNGTKGASLAFETPGTSLADINDEFPENLSLKSPVAAEAAIRVCPGSIGGAQFTSASHDPGSGLLFVGMNDFCFFYYKWNGAGLTQPDLSLGTPPQGWVTALDGETGAVKWRYHAPAQVQAGTVPTKSGLVFAGDTLGNLYAFDAKGDNGKAKVLKRIDAGGALNSGLVSYQVDGTQYVAANVGGVTLNPPGVTAPLRPGGPLRVKIYALNAATSPTMVTAAPISPPLSGAQVYTSVCLTCHGLRGIGSIYPTLERQGYFLTDKDHLKTFFETVPPPMPKLYEAGKPSLLSDHDVAALADYFKTVIKPEAGYARPPVSGSDPWSKVYSVMTYPRCINCHTMSDFPRQQDVRHPHLYDVTRGALTGQFADRGTAIRRCAYCHGETNNPKTGVPGAPDWHLAPLSMAWEQAPNVAMTGPQLCAMLKDPKKNGGRNPEALLAHLEVPDSLIVWAFDPGKDVNGHERSKPPLTYDRFVEAFRGWVRAGASCPK